MSTKPIIEVENLSKKFIISHEAPQRYRSMREVISEKISTVISSKKSKADSAMEEFWALKEVNFKVHPGDRIGIIGRNGAGKSTLLKILSRITPPTTGRISIHGRVASLLEVGTGFHPELTGRENVFLNGAILGMSRAEIQRKFEEIVDFAEVEKFLDTPVKRYSSGMYVRLAFAVAAHLEPEILIVDEVLAVGDAQFQKKCLGKMEDVSRNEGRTILFVSHNFHSLKAICTKGILLSKGLLIETGEINHLIDSYENTIYNNISTSNSYKNDQFNVSYIINSEKEIFFNKLFKLELCIEINGNSIYGVVSIAFNFTDETRSFTIDTEELLLKSGINNLTLTYKNIPISPGPYSMICVFRNKSNTITYWSISNNITVLSDHDTPLEIANCKNTQSGVRGTLNFTNN